MENRPVSDRDAPQVNFDEMVPDRRVFTQMVAFELGDKTLNRLNQLHATGDAAQEVIGPKKDLPDPDPRALRLLKGLLTLIAAAGLPLWFFLCWDMGPSGVLPDLTLAMGMHPGLRVLLGVALGALLVRLGVSGIQKYLSHRRWLRSVRE